MEGYTTKVTRNMEQSFNLLYNCFIIFWKLAYFLKLNKVGIYVCVPPMPPHIICDPNDGLSQCDCAHDTASRCGPRCNWHSLGGTSKSWDRGLQGYSPFCLPACFRTHGKAIIHTHPLCLASFLYCGCEIHSC
jgi:hypothetical protein